MGFDSIAITDSAGLIIAAAASREKTVFTNSGVNIVYIAKDSSVTDTNGFPVGIGKTFVDEVYTGDWYGICASGLSSTIDTIEE